MDAFDIGLRVQDVNAGIRNLDPSEPVLVSLAETQRLGMAAGVATLIRGQEVVENAQNLRAVAADRLDVPPSAFNDVIYALAEAGLVSSIRKDAHRIVSFSENVPFYSSLYPMLGEAWTASGPNELEQQLVLLTDGLAKAPIPRDSVVDRLGLDGDDLDLLLDVSTAAQLVQIVESGPDEILYSPFFGFENPALVADIAREHGTQEVSDAFEQIRFQQGIPVSHAGPVIESAVAQGLLIAPSVELPDGRSEAFATLPYSIEPSLLKERKPVLEKGLAVVASLRTGQHFGGYSSLPEGSLPLVISKFLREGALAPHSSHERQYRMLRNLGVIRLEPDPKPGGRWKVPTLIDTEDNRAALGLAKDLVTHGEAMNSRPGNLPAEQSLLDNAEDFYAPLRTVEEMKRKRALKSKPLQKFVDELMGHTAR